MQEKKETIREYYNADPKKEWDRLQKEHPFEKYITINMMERYIKPGSRILDVGGGPGHYSIHFAGKDHDVKDAKTFMDSISGLKTKTMFGQESILASYKYQLMESTKKIRDAWYEYGIKFCEKEDYLTHSEHLMFVSVKDL